MASRRWAAISPPDDPRDGDGDGNGEEPDWEQVPDDGPGAGTGDGDAPADATNGPPDDGDGTAGTNGDAGDGDAGEETRSPDARDTAAPDGAPGDTSDGDARAPADGDPVDPRTTGPGDADSGAEPESAPAALAATESWPVAYLRDHRVHAVVIALFALYPFIYAGLTGVVPGVFTTLLPGIPLMVTVLAFGLFAMSFDFISGYTGYLSFGHAAFFGIGGYTVILAANGKVPLVPTDLPFVLLLVVAGLLAAVAAVLVGAVSFRLTGVYFAMITLGFSQVIYVLLRNWDYVGSNPRTGASLSFQTRPDAFSIGVPYVDSLSLTIGRLTGDTFSAGPVALSTTEVSYVMVGLVVLVSYFAMQRVLHSPFGRVMIAIRENEERARAVGYETYRYKMAAFAISAFFAGVAGGLLAGFETNVSPDNYLFFLVAGNALLAAIIGGFGTLAGPLYGWLFFETLTELLEPNVSQGVPDGLLPFLQETLGPQLFETTLVAGITLGTVLETLFSGRASLYIGLLFVLFVLYVPNGLLGTLRDSVGGRFIDRPLGRD